MIPVLGMRIAKRWLLQLMVGAVALTALTCKDSPTEPEATIALGSTTMAFSATAGSANPVCLTVTVANSGGGRLSGLAVTITHGTGQTTGWLTATLDRTTAPATLTLCAATGTLLPGTYSATVAMSSPAADNSPQSVTVTFTVTLPPLVSPTNLTATAVSPTQIDLAWTDNAVMEDGFQVWRCAGAGCTDVVRVTSLGANTTSYADEGLNPATSYSYRVRAFNASGTSDDSNIATAVTQSGPAIALDPATVTFAGSAAGPDPAPQTVAVTNSGGGILGGVAVGTIAYGTGQPTGWLGAGIDRLTAPATVTLNAVTGALLPGSYSAVVPITSAEAGNSPQEIAVTFTLGPAAVAAVVVSPGGAAISAAAGTQAFTAEARDARGGVIEGRMFTWSSLNPAVATIGSSSGVATAAGSGQVTIAATADGVTGYALLTVTIPGATPVTQWSPVATTQTGFWNHVWGASADNVFVVGDHGHILRFNGSSWEPMSSGTNQVLYGVWGTSATNVYAVGLNGTVRRYDGNSWGAVATGFPANAYAVWGSAPNDVFIVGGQGHIVHYSGSTWGAMTSPTSEDLFGIWGSSGTDAWAVGRNGTLIHYDGSSWTAVSPGTTRNLIGIWGASDSDVFAVGGAVLRYNGATWGTVNTGFSVGLEDVWGSSSSDVYAVQGGFDPILRFDGTSWAESNAEFPGVLEGAWGTFDGDVWAVGSAGTMLRGIRGPLIGLHPASVSFTATQGAADPAAQSLSITNVGGGTLNDLAVRPVGYGAGQPNGWLGATLNRATAPATLTLMAATGTLAAGTYEATVPVIAASAANSPQTVSVTFTVVVAPPAAPTNLTATAVPPRQINLAWTDNATDEDGFYVERCVGAGCSDFAIIGGFPANATTWQYGALESATTYSYRLRAFNAGGASEYSNVASATTLARLEVVVAGDGAVTSEPSGIDCGGGGSACAFDFPSGAVVTLSAAAADGWQFLQWSGACAGAGACQVAMEGDRDVTAAFGERPLIALAPPIVSFGATAGGGDPAAQAVAVTNAGGGTLDQLAVGTIAYGAGEPTGWLAAALDQAAAPATLTLEATTGPLAPGTYEAAVPIGSPAAANSPQVVTVSFTVGAAPAIALSPEAVVFDEAVAGGQNPGAQTVAVTNDGTGTLGGLAVGTIAYGPGQPTGWLSGTLDGATAPATLTLQATITSLAAGSYTASVPVTSPAASNSPQTVTATLTVTVALVPDLTVTGLGGGPISVTPTGVPPGGSTTLSAFTLRNLGTAPSGPFDWGIYLSVDAVITAADTRLFGSTLGSLGPGGSVSSGAIPITIPAPTPQGDYFLGVLVDGPDAVTESNEGNNYSTAALAVRTIPPAPSNLEANAASSSSIRLTWTDNSSDETGFRIERCTGQFGSCTTVSLVGQVGANVTTFVHGGLAAPTTYRYQVRALNGSVVSGPSNSASATTQAAGTPPAPSNLTATAASVGQISLSWTGNSANETEFQVWRCLGSTCTSFAQVATLGAGVTSYQDAGLGETTSYRYRVRASNATGPSGFTNTATATTLAASAPPAAPSGFGPTAVSGNQVNLAWTDNATNESGFRVERCTIAVIPPGGVGGGACASEQYGEIAVLGANSMSYQDAGLAGSTLYGYRVRAYNSVGSSAYAVTQAQTLPVPAAPSGLTATAVSDDRINLSWTDNSTNETGFRIERCSIFSGTSCSTSFSQIATVGAGVTTYANTSLSPDDTYRYRVLAFNANGVSPYSNTATATTLPIPAPSGLTATALSSGRIRLQWINNYIGHRIEIERCAGSGCTNFAEVAELDDGAAMSFTNFGLAAATSYSYRVRTTLGATRSPYSNIATATTPAVPAAPTGLVATVVSSSQINLSWTDNSSTESGFLVERCTGESCTNFTQITGTAANAMSYANTALAGASTYRYRVRATDGDHHSEYTSVVGAATPPAPGAPAAPSGLVAAAVSSSQINLTWADNATNETGYSVERCTGTGCTNFAPIVTANAVNVTTYQNTGLAAATTYRYRVRVFNAAGNSLYSNTATATTP